jgi:molybdenum cofactor cytidylyltransferase
MPKPLLPFAGRALVEAAARSALEAGCRVLLVVGNRGDEVVAPFDAADYGEARAEGRLCIVRNPAWAEGMVGSIQAALPLVRGEAFFVAHADMPFVGPEDYCAIAAARLASPPGAFCGSHQGEAGHPVLLPSAWIQELLALPAGDRLRPFLAGRPLTPVETGPGALRDIDTPGEYEAALEHFA